MKRGLVITLVMVIILAVAGTVSASGFVDVPKDQWAYNAVKKLAADGILDGYGNGTFNGDKTLTRYEFAVIVAKAMAKEEQANAEQKALIRKLATEYRDELEQLVLRLQGLEEKTDKIHISGYSRIRFDEQSGASTYNDHHMNININFIYKVNDDWVVKTESEWQRQFDKPSAGDSAGINAINSSSYSTCNAQVEQLYIYGPIGKSTIIFGKYNYRPVYGLAFDTRVMGGEATFGNVVKTTLSSSKSDLDAAINGIDLEWVLDKESTVKAGYQVVDYFGTKTKYSSVGFNTQLSDDLMFTAAADKSDEDINNKAYFATLQYKAADVEVVGSRDLFLTYRKVPENAVYYTDKDIEDRILDLNFKGTRVGFDYVPMKNSKFTAWYMSGKDIDTNGDRKVSRAQFELYF
ncbi:MAG: S-layer y domain protein [Firmicutes bacterium]|nr:S-layer y domain protein [Bacillota bacterium]